MMLDYYDPQPRWTRWLPSPCFGMTLALAGFGINQTLLTPAAD